jgi:hypothetical protein
MSRDTSHDSLRHTIGRALATLAVLVMLAAIATREATVHGVSMWPWHHLQCGD